MIDESLGEFGEALDRPTLSWPAGGRCDDGVAFGVFDDDLGEFVFAGVEAHVWRGDWCAGGFDEFEHAIDGVEGAWGFDALVEEDPCDLLGVPIADTDWGAGGPGEVSRAGEPLGIDDHVVVCVFEFTNPAEQWPELALFTLCTKGFAIKGNCLMEIWVMFDCFGEVVLDEPIDLGVGVLGFEGRE